MKPIPALILLAAASLSTGACNKAPKKVTCESLCMSDEKCSNLAGQELGSGKPDQGGCATFCTLLRAEFKAAAQQDKAFVPNHACWPAETK